MSKKNPTLRKLLRQMEPGTKVKIGAKNGSGYFYVGESDEFESHYEKYNLMIEGYWKTRQTNAETRLKELIQRECTLEYFILHELRSQKPNLTVDGYRAYLTRCLSSVWNAHKSIEKIKSIRENLQKLEAREVLDSFMSDNAADPGYRNIQITGFEMGRFWYSGEAQKKPVMRFNTMDGDGEEAQPDAETV